VGLATVTAEVENRGVDGVYRGNEALEPVLRLVAAGVNGLAEAIEPRVDLMEKRSVYAIFVNLKSPEGH